MNRLKNIWLFAFIVLTSFKLVATPLEDYHATLDIVRQQFNNRYGSEEIKAKNFNWRIDTEIQKFRDEGDQIGSAMTVEKAQSLIQNFFRSMRDYHVIVYKQDWTGASLPFNVKEFKGKTYVVSIADSTLTGQMKVGDEVLSMDNQSVSDFIDQIATPRPYQFNKMRERFWSSSWVTKRYIALLIPQPRAPETVLVLKHFGQSEPFTERVKWINPKTAPLSHRAASKPGYKNIPAVMQNMNMSEIEEARINEPFLSSINPSLGKGSIPDQINPFSGKQSYFSPDEKTIWNNEATKKYFHAWITVLPNRQKLGVIRVASFSPGAAADYKQAIVEFESLVKKMNTDSDRLVLDMLGNTGGMIDYGYAMVSYFIKSKVKTYDFKYRLYPQLIASKDQFKMQIPQMRALKTQQEVEAYFQGDHYFGFPVDLDFVNEMADFYQNMVNAIESGRSFSNKYHYNAAYIKPNQRVQYLKPLYVLVDENSISCGDMIPALFQDIKRATIIGRTTAGAGAFVGGEIQVVNPLQLNGMQIPFAPGYRYDGTPVENRGVKPNIWVDLTHQDFGTEFVAFRNKVLKAVAK
jgi:C-terminal processing protease CtpA/Prc